MNPACSVFAANALKSTTRSLGLLSKRALKPGYVQFVAELVYVPSVIAKRTKKLI